MAVAIVPTFDASIARPGIALLMSAVGRSALSEGALLHPPPQPSHTPASIGADAVTAIGPKANCRPGRPISRSGRAGDERAFDLTREGPQMINQSNRPFRPRALVVDDALAKLDTSLG